MLDRQADEIWKSMDEETKSAYGEEAFRKSYEAFKDHGVSFKQFSFFKQMIHALVCKFGGGNPGKGCKIKIKIIFIYKYSLFYCCLSENRTFWFLV